MLALDKVLGRWSQRLTFILGPFVLFDPFTTCYILLLFLSAPISSLSFLPASPLSMHPRIPPDPCPSALPIQLPACHSPARIPPILPGGRNESFPVWPPGSSLRLALGRLEREGQANRLRSEGSSNALSTQGSWVERDTILPRSPVRDRKGGVAVQKVVMELSLSL